MAVTRVSGLISGMDTETMVKQLMNAESLKMNRLKQQRQLIEWKQLAYRDVASNLKSFQNTFSSLSGSSISTSLRLAANFNIISSSVTDDKGIATNVIKATAKNANAIGSFSLNVLSTAKEDAYVSEAQDMTYSTDLDPENLLDEKGNLKLKAGDSFSVRLDGAAAVTFQLTESDITDITAVDKELKAEGKKNKIVEIINEKLLNRFGYETDEKGNQILNNNNPVQKVSFKSVSKTITETVNGKEVTKEISTLSFVASKGHTVQVNQGDTDTDILSKLGYEKGGTTGIDTSVSLKELNFDFLDAEGKESPLSFSINGTTITLDSEDTLDDFMNKINNSEAGVTLSFDKLRSAFKLETNRTGASAAIKTDEASKLFLSKIGFDLDDNTTRLSTASDAVFEYNGVQLSRENNNFELDGVSITLTDTAVGAGKIDITSTRDTQKPFELIVKFVDEYNKMIEAINKQTNTSRPRSDSYSYYEPLTDDERAAMSEKDIELWEEKAKTGMLYRDDILTTLNSQLRSMIYAPVERSDGSFIALYQIGVTTSNADGYIGKLEIDEDKLRTALEENPEAVSDLFTKGSSKPGVTIKERKDRLLDEGLGDRLNDIINNTIGLGGTIYEKAGLENTSSLKNNALFNLLSDQDNKISDMLNYLYERENYYYNMFAKMESAMAQANSQASALTSLF